MTHLDNVEGFLKQNLTFAMKKKDLNIEFFSSCEVEFYCDKSNIDEIMEEIKKITTDFKVDKEFDENQFEISLEKDSFQETIKKATAIQSFLQTSELVNFCAKPIEMQAGCSMQFNVSIYVNKVNIFQKIRGEYTEPLLFAISGLLRDVNKSMLIFNPTENCYKRFHFYDIEKIEKQNIHYPVNISWGVNNRTTSLRVPIKNQTSYFDLYIEHRVPSVLCDVEKTLSVIFFSAIQGIIDGKLPQEQTYGNAHDSHYFLTPLTKNLHKAQNDIKNSKIEVFLNEFFSVIN